MVTLNSFKGIGALTKDPDVGVTKAGKAAATLALAINTQYRKADGTWQQETCYVNAHVYGKMAEHCGKNLRKGGNVLVEGRLRTDEWEKDGRKYTRLAVEVSRVQFLRFASSQQGSAGEEEAS